jgi:Xaa-Pro aminopeptidase
VVGFDYKSRIDRLQAAMSALGLDAVILSVGADLPYFTGYEAMASERLTVFVVRSEGEPVLFVPELEAPRVADADFEVQPWGELADPVTMAAGLVAGSSSVGVGDHMWSAFLIRFQQALPHMDWRPASAVTKGLRMRKDPQEIEALRQAAHGVDRVMARIPAEVRFGGRTERQVSHDLMELTLEEGHQVAGFGIVGSGPNGASPHHGAGDRVIGERDVVVCDFGGRWNGYHSDSTRTFVVGGPSSEQTEVHSIVESANGAGRSAVAPGTACQEIDRAARSVIEESGFGEHFIHRTGHGIGLEIHEHPYMVEGNELPLEPGMTFSVEPGIYLPGRFGVRIEDIVVCGDNGADILNESDRSLVRVG